MKTFWLAACAASALALGAVPALAADDISKAPRMGPWGFDAAGRDLSVSPRDDLYLYANGTYLKNLEIPADRSRYGSFDKLNELSVNRMRAVLEAAAADKAATGDQARIGIMYRSFMDEAAVNALGAKPMAAAEHSPMIGWNSMPTAQAKSAKTRRPDR